MHKANKIALATAASAGLIASGVFLGVGTSAGASGSADRHSGSAVAAAKARAASVSPAVVGNFVDIPAGGNGSTSVNCPRGTFLTGGGWQTSGFGIFATDSFATGNTWNVIAHNTGNSTQSIRAFARCIRGI